MRQAAGEQITNPPTQEMASTLQLLGMLDNITPTQFSLYAEQMKDSHLAMQSLQQIAKAHEQHIYVDDPDHVNGTPKAMYFLGDVKALSAFIQKMTAGAEDSLVEDITNEILSNCPEQYGAIYRNYKATGEMLDLNEPMTE